MMGQNHAILFSGCMGTVMRAGILEYNSLVLIMAAACARECEWVA